MDDRIDEPTVDSATESSGAEQPPGGDAAGTDLPVLATAGAAFLSTCAMGWMAGGIFHGSFPRFAGLIGPVVGVGLVALSMRSKRPSVWQYLTLPAAIAVGAVLVGPEATGGTANLVSLVKEAVRIGGVAQPPIAFDPGWRFLLVVLTALVGTATASIAIAERRPRLAVLLPVPLMIALALLQPPEAANVSSLVALVLVIAALALAYGVNLASVGATSGRFEFKRLTRAAGVVVLMVIPLIALSRAGFLFPEETKEQTIPPKRPEVQPPQADRVLFTVKAERPQPWRLGVLDVYQDTAWLLPPYSPDRLVDVAPSGDLREDGLVKETITATFTIVDVEGHVIPSLAGAKAIHPTGFKVQYDPRTQMLRLPDRRAGKGMRYVIEAPPLPRGADLADALPPPAGVKEFLTAPVAPNSVVKLLDGAPTNAWDRLQYIRDALYHKVVAAGVGNPVDVPPSRVAKLLGGAEASPFEITAAEALLARWAGIPSRIGYGFYGGEQAGDELAVRPRHGATWLEAYFQGHGWVPLIGTPPRAKASLTQQQKREEPQVRPSEDIALIVYVPISLQTVALLFEQVRYWLSIALPIALVLALIWLATPGIIKSIRRIRQRRRAHADGPGARVIQAYGEFRDMANDLGIGLGVMTPMEFLDEFERDQEHTELAWLVTRAMWGDIRRDLRPEDADAAEAMARSVSRRVRRLQPFLPRVLAFASRASLRDPYVPTDRAQRTVSSRAVRIAIATLALLGVVGTTLMVSGSTRREAGARRLPSSMVPAGFDDIRFKLEPPLGKKFIEAGSNSLVREGHVFTLRRDGELVGYLQTGLFKPETAGRGHLVRSGVLRSIGAGAFEQRRIANELVYSLTVGEQNFLLWFSENDAYFDLLVTRPGFDEAEHVFARVLATQLGLKAVPDRREIQTYDPRRGADL